MSWSIALCMSCVIVNLSTCTKNQNTREEPELGGCMELTGAHAAISVFSTEVSLYFFSCMCLFRARVIPFSIVFLRDMEIMTGCQSSQKVNKIARKTFSRTIPAPKRDFFLSYVRSLVYSVQEETKCQQRADVWQKPNPQLIIEKMSQLRSLRVHNCVVLMNLRRNFPPRHT